MFGFRTHETSDENLARDTHADIQRLISRIADKLVANGETPRQARNMATEAVYSIRL